MAINPDEHCLSIVCPATVLGRPAASADNRAIRALKPYSVEVAGARVTIRDRADLARLAKPNPLIDDPRI